MDNAPISFTKRCNGIEKKLISPAFIISHNEEMEVYKAQWDTGASASCISQSVIDRLDLKPVSQTMVQTPSGNRVMNMYLIDVRLINNLVIKDIRAIGSEIGAQGIDLLIGMDIIGVGDFAVSNYNGVTQFSFRFPSQGDFDFTTTSKQKC